MASHWTQEHKERVKALFSKDIRILMVGFNFYNKKSTQSIAVEELQNYDIILGYDSARERYVVWNAHVQSFCAKNDGKRTMRLQANRLEIENLKLMAAYYRPLNVHDKYEKYLFQKVLVLTKEGIEVFSKNPVKFLLPNTEDKEFPKKFVNDNAEIFCINQRISLGVLKARKEHPEKNRQFSASWVEKMKL